MRERTIGLGRSAGAFARNQAVLVASGALALISMLISPPSEAYLEYIDVRVLCILFCFMAVVTGMSGCRAFETLAQRILSGRRGIGSLCLLLSVLPFACSMFVTNDVALIAFVPFAILVLDMAGRRDLVIPVVVLQTVSANLGSMVLPFGNPQNIYICSTYGLGLGDFIVTMVPLAAVSLAAITVLSLRGGRETVHVEFEDRCSLENRGFLAVLSVLFMLCIAAVLGWVPYWAVLVLTVVSIAAVKPRTLLGVDYGLLLTFVFLFVFTGNISHVDAVGSAIQGLMEQQPLLTSLGLSQVISNVPAAVMLSGFTDNWQALLLGVDVGGLGTPIASMASIISLRLYMGSGNADTRRYLVHFTAVNLLLLAILVPMSMLIL